ncbi:MAG: ral nucleoside transport system ATP-binding protein [Abditibacteriota bacterium]|nr:ral nucleoside transport system ATP-binding protein [Abditibacteriota bacterium]
MLELRSVSKRFGSFAALSAVDFAVQEGEIVGLLGENGAGKSTCINLIGGNFTPTAGEILWQNRPASFASPRDATRAGIGVVHQHFRLVPVFSIAENLALQGQFAEPGWKFDHQLWQERVEGWARSLNWRLEAGRRVEELGVGERQRVEILKALFAGTASSSRTQSTSMPGDSSQSTLNRSPSGARLLLLDEPTANLAPPEIGELFSVLHDLKAQGRSVIFVSHKLDEVLSLCDRVVVLRRGRVVGERRAAETSQAELAELMVGRQLDALAVPKARAPGFAGAAVKLDIQKLCGGKLRDVSLQVHAGEIVGLAGVDGNGQAELIDVLSGLRPLESGAWRAGASVNSSMPMSPHQSTLAANPIALIPPDRQRTGLILEFDLAENMALHPALRAECARPLRFDWSWARQKTRELMTAFDVRAPQTGERAAAMQLSGGNQQKLVIARALSFPHEVVVAADPTRGLDVGAASFVHEQLRAAAARGASVLLISSDLDEVLSLADSIGVFFDGRVLPGPNLLPAGTPRATIGALMGGASLEENTLEGNREEERRTKGDGER